MAESDVLKKEDVDDITDVLQVAPHQKNNQFSAVTKSQAGDLVSLDELYEKTGQEAIRRFIDGFEELARTDRLSRAHGMALNIQGAEHWFALPDIHNSRIGKESFLGAVKKGVVAIVKAIMAFVKGVCNWIYTRISSLLGFSRTVAETKFIYERSEDWRNLMAGLLETLGLNGAQSSAFLATLENNLTYREMLVLTKSRLDSNEKAFERLQNVQAKMGDYTRAINGWNKNLRLAKRAGDANVGQLRRLLTQRHPITTVDITDIATHYTTIVKEHLNPEEPVKYLNELIDSLYGIEIEGLGVESDITLLRDTLKTQTETFKQTYDKDAVEEVDAFIRQVYQFRFTNQTLPEIDKDIVNNLRKMTDENDAKVIQQVDDMVVGGALTQAYLSFCKSVSTYAESIEVILNVVQRVDKSLVNILKWRADLNTLLPALLTRDVLAFKEALDTLTPETSAKLSKHTEILLDNIEQDYQRHASTKDQLYSLVSRSIQDYFTTPNGKKMLGLYQKHKNRIATV